MSVNAADNGAKRLTLVFELAAAQRLRNPADVFADARQWSRHVGIVSNDQEAVEEYLGTHDLEQDFDLGAQDKWLAMAEIRDETSTPRHVFVGTGSEDRRIADQIGWEFIHVSEAAEKAGWKLQRETNKAGLLARVRRRLTPFPWPFRNE